MAQMRLHNWSKYKEVLSKDYIDAIESNGQLSDDGSITIDTNKEPLKSLNLSKIIIDNDMARDHIKYKKGFYSLEQLKTIETNKSICQKCSNAKEIHKFTVKCKLCKECAMVSLLKGPCLDKKWG